MILFIKFQKEGDVQIYFNTLKKWIQGGFIFTHPLMDDNVGGNKEVFLKVNGFNSGFQFGN